MMSIYCLPPKCNGYEARYTETERAYIHVALAKMKFSQKQKKEPNSYNLNAMNE